MINKASTVAFYMLAEHEFVEKRLTDRYSLHSTNIGGYPVQAGFRAGDCPGMAVLAHCG